MVLLNVQVKRCLQSAQLLVLMLIEQMLIHVLIYQKLILSQVSTLASLTLVAGLLRVKEIV